MIITLIRTFILYVIVLFSIRSIGKNGLSSTDPFQIVMMLMISEIASIPVESPDTPLFHGLAAIFMILLIYSLSGYLSGKSEIFKKIINGKPSILIDNGAINFKELKKSNITFTDLMEMLRLKDCPSIIDVLFAYLETNGELSIILKPEKSPVTREDLKIVSTYNNMPCILVSDGMVYPDNLLKVGVNSFTFEEIIAKSGIGDIKEISLCFCDEKGQVFVYPKDSADKILPVCVVKK